MKKKIMLLWMIAFSANALTIDPTVDPSQTLVCDTPLTFTNGDPIPAGDVETITFYESEDQLTWTVKGTATECRLVIDSSDMVDGQSRYYVLSATVDGRESVQSGESAVLTALVKRVPNPPTNPRWES